MPIGIYKRVPGVNCGFNKGKKFTKEHRKKLSEAHKGQVAWCTGKKNPKVTGEKNFNWKGDKASKVAIHLWVRRHRGKPQAYSICGRTVEETVIDYANIDHKYKRNLEDYIPMCRKCHRNYDYKNHLCNKGSKWGSISNKK